MAAFEVKAAGRVPGEDFRGLRKRREALGDAFLAGAVLSTGQRSCTFEDRLHALPIDRLWTTECRGSPSATDAAAPDRVRPRTSLTCPNAPPEGVSPR